MEKSVDSEVERRRGGERKRSYTHENGPEWMDKGWVRRKQNKKEQEESKHREIERGRL